VDVVEADGGEGADTLAAAKHEHEMVEGGEALDRALDRGVADQPDMKLVVYTPLEEEQTVRKLQTLLRGS